MSGKWEIVDLDSQCYRPCPELVTTPPLAVNECLFQGARKLAHVHELPTAATSAEPALVLLGIVVAAERTVVVGSQSQRVLPGLHSAFGLVEPESHWAGLGVQWVLPY